MNELIQVLDTLKQKYNHFYQLTLASMSQYRFKHTMGVVELAVELALKHNVEVDKAYLAALLHDLCKEWDDDHTIDYLYEKDPSVLGLNIKILHQFSCYYYLQEHFQMDVDVLDAIGHHATGTSNKRLAKLLFIADKMERNRKFDTSVGREIAMQNIDEGFLYCKEMVQKHVEKGS